MLILFLPSDLFYICNQDHGLNLLSLSDFSALICYFLFHLIVLYCLLYSVFITMLHSSCYSIQFSFFLFTAIFSLHHSDLPYKIRSTSFPPHFPSLSSAPIYSAYYPQLFHSAMLAYQMRLFRSCSVLLYHICTARSDWISLDQFSQISYLF